MLAIKEQQIKTSKERRLRGPLPREGESTKGKWWGQHRCDEHSFQQRYLRGEKKASDRLQGGEVALTGKRKKAEKGKR